MVEWFSRWVWCVRSPVYARKKNSFFSPDGTCSACNSACNSTCDTDFFAHSGIMPSKSDVLIVGQDDQQFIKPMLFQGLGFSRANSYFLAPNSWFDRDNFKFMDLEHIDHSNPSEDDTPANFFYEVPTGSISTAVTGTFNLSKTFSSFSDNVSFYCVIANNAHSSAYLKSA